jgi:hypothetical protein
MRLPSFRSTKSETRHSRISVGAGHDFDEPHVARRIEEMGDQKVLFELIVPPLDQMAKRNRRGIGRYRRARTLELLELGVERLLDVEPFDDRLDDPVAFGHPLEMVVDIARFNELRRSLRHEGRRIGLQHLRDRTLRHGVTIAALLGHDIEQQHRHAGIGDLRCDAGAHDACADHADLFDGFRRGADWLDGLLAHSAASSTVAMP